MTIAEIESTLRTLRTRHLNLDEEMLITLLTAGGWENKTIQEAIVVFRSLLQREPIVTRPNPVLVVPKIETENSVLASTDIPPIIISQNEGVKIVASEAYNPEASHMVNVNTLERTSIPVAEIVYYNNTGEEEGVLQVVPGTEAIVSKEKVAKIRDIPELIEQKVEQKLPNQEIQRGENPLVSEGKDIQHIVKSQELTESKVEQPLPSQAVRVVKNTVIIGGKEEGKITEPQSLVEQKVEQKSLSREIEPPENLPLKPFESTPHVWPFSKYKEVFHGDAMLPLPADERAIVNSITGINNTPVKKIKVKRIGFHGDNEDEGLIFLTGTTLLIILLLLAYMYSNGRL